QSFTAQNIAEIIQTLTTDQKQILSPLFPNYVTYIPKIFDDQVQNSEPDLLSKFLLEHRLDDFSPNFNVEQYKNSVRGSIKNMLSVVDLHQLKEKLSNTPALVHLIDLKCEEIPNLVEFNPLIASEILISAIKHSHSREYFYLI
ncbi:MAG: CCR4-NOT transcription complex subunit 11, partial [Paramarteilia canceri]